MLSLTTLQLVFKRHAHDRTIPFTVVAEAAQVALDQVGTVLRSNMNKSGEVVSTGSYSV